MEGESANATDATDATDFPGSVYNEDEGPRHPDARKRAALEQAKDDTIRDDGGPEP